MDQGTPQREWGEDGLPIGETAEERGVREAREAESVARGHADFAAGRYYEEDEIEVWLDQLELDDNAPMPVPRALLQR